MPRIEDELRHFVIDNFMYGREGNFSDDDSFLDMGVIDSTGMLELVGFIENKYGITVEDIDLIPENLDSISRVAQFVNRKIRPGESRAAMGIRFQAAHTD